ncbi:ArsR family transcriptional regulator [Kocuria tytonicola]|uniref:ArsR family transcriptional regulator n=1 Tax=Kocuria tytonicola TaxID=2055946 RepID=A0A3L9KZQ9_9MICC|nr:helix-turn-helix domain-containing protein [Kocuria tytonicola]RLY92326.1 ArsR family transcriptional regulator [Kocuria tytonicola]
MDEDKNLPVAMTPEQMKAFSHPLRMRLYRLLEDQGQATASMLARQTGESSGQTSYHLRQLAKYGFVGEVEGSGSSRQRWWRAQSFSFEDVGTAPAVVVEGLRDWTVEAVVNDLRRSVAGSARDSPWSEAGTLTTYTQWMTSEELAALTTEMLRTLKRHSEAAEQRRKGEGKMPGDTSERAGERRVRIFLHSFSLPDEHHSHDRPQAHE